MFSGMPIKSSEFCTRKVFNFKESKNRSRRLHKKMLAKYGGVQYREVPAMYMISGNIVGHPDAIKQMVEQNKIVRIMI